MGLKLKELLHEDRESEIVKALHQLLSQHHATFSMLVRRFHSTPELDPADLIDDERVPFDPLRVAADFHERKAFAADQDTYVRAVGVAYWHHSDRHFIRFLIDNRTRGSIEIWYELEETP